MGLITKRLLPVCICVLFVAGINAQSSQPVSTNITDINRMINIYHTWAGAHDPVYNGREYERYGFYINRGIPYFIADSLTTATMVYDGIQYDRVLLLYDLVVDELITTSHDGKKLVKLVKEKIDSFNIHGARFIRISNNKIVPDGYYQLIYDGQSEILRKVVKRLEERVRDGEQLQKDIVSKVTYYVKENDQYRRVNNKNAIKSYDKLTR